MQTDYTLTPEYREAVQVNEGTWRGMDLGRALDGAKMHERYLANRDRAIDQMPNILKGAGALNWANPDQRRLAEAQRAWALGDSPSLKAAQEAFATGTGRYELNQQPLTQAQLEYLHAKAKLTADKLKPRAPTQQDQQLDYSYRNGFAAGRASMAKLVASITTIIVLAAMAVACIALIWIGATA